MLFILLCDNLLLLFTNIFMKDARFFFFLRTNLTISVIEKICITDPKRLDNIGTQKKLMFDLEIRLW